MFLCRPNIWFALTAFVNIKLHGQWVITSSTLTRPWLVPLFRRYLLMSSPSDTYPALWHSDLTPVKPLSWYLISHLDRSWNMVPSSKNFMVAMTLNWIIESKRLLWHLIDVTYDIWCHTPPMTPDGRYTHDTYHNPFMVIYPSRHPCHTLS